VERWSGVKVCRDSEKNQTVSQLYIYTFKPFLRVIRAFVFVKSGVGLGRLKSKSKMFFRGFAPFRVSAVNVKNQAANVFLLLPFNQLDK
jgi:hypothetical protein